MNDLSDELVSSFERLDRRSADWLRQTGVSEFAARYGWPGPIGLARITSRENFFEFDETGELAFVVPVRAGGACTEAIDAIAWRPENSARFWTKLGIAFALGLDALDRAELLGEPLKLHASVLDWLLTQPVEVGHSLGVFVVDWGLADRFIRAVPELLIDKLAFAEEVDRRLSAPPRRVPRILVRARSAAA